MQLSPALLLSVAIALPLTQDAGSDGVRGVRVDRDLQAGSWLPAGAVGGRPIDALTPGWPWYRLIVEADLGEPEQADAVSGLIDKADKLDRRVTLLVVDLGDRDAHELDWLLWTKGWHQAQVAFATEVDATQGRAEPGWRLATDAPTLSGSPLLRGSAPPAFEGELGRASAVLDDVGDALGEDEDFYAAHFSRRCAKLAADLDLVELAELEREVNAKAGMSPEVTGEAASILLLVPSLQQARGHLAAEAEVALRMGQPLDAQRAVERLERVFGEDPVAAELVAELEPLGLDKQGLKADKDLRKILGDELGSRPDKVRTKLESFLKRRRPEFVAARAQHYLALLERFAPAADE